MLNKNLVNFSAETYGAAVKKAKAYTDAVIAALPNGVVYKGAVSYYNDLPNNAEIGDAYTVKYAGTSGTDVDGTEYVWGTFDSTNQWIAIGADMSQYQKLLVSGTNIKTVGNESVLGSGDIAAEMTANKVTSISAQSTDTQYPTAKCVYDIVGNVETLLAAI